MTHMPSPNSFIADVVAAARRACGRIAPAFPLQATVAVNPYLGFAGETLLDVAARMERIGGPRPVMEPDWYRQKLALGAVTDADIAAAIATLGLADRFDPALVRALVERKCLVVEPVPTVGDLLAGEGRADLGMLGEDRLCAFAAAYFDAGQAMWRPENASGAFAAWREFAMHDLVPELTGLSGFCRQVTALPSNAGDAVAESLVNLGVGSAAAESYCLQLLQRLGGWAEAARLPGWHAEREGRQEDTLLALLAASLAFEAAILAQAPKDIHDRWARAVARHAQPPAPSQPLIATVILQTAFERAVQRGLAQRLAAPRTSQVPVRTQLKAFFCIDVRSEVFRRALETVSPQIETGGFAGFFGIGTAHRRFGSVAAEHRLPVLLSPRICTEAGDPSTDEARIAFQLRARARRALQRFSHAAVASFAYVEAAGLGYVTGLAGASLKRARKTKPEPQPHLLPAMTRDEKVSAAKTVLGAMSLHDEFPAIVLIVGHGANVSNNPFASALACGACGGHAGDVNARVLASLLNDADTRKGLIEHGIAIPQETCFLSALHDTTSDEVTVFEDDLSPRRMGDLDQVKAWLAKAAVLARTERAMRLPGAAGESDVARRGGDWSELRPEWGLAGCAAFVAAPRAATLGLSLQGRAFLHDYDWHRDRDFAVLELILTAPVVVASWISLQYYGSAVAPAHHGSGNKLLHNVVGGMGVVEGNGGRLRTGLPWQSVHDGTSLVHEPVRLTIFVAAPQSAVNAIIARHDHLRDLFDNGWLMLATLDDEGYPTARYCGQGAWEAIKAA
jgi:uncharacterized protein